MISYMIDRHAYRKQVHQALKRSPVVALLGARQTGKTTLAQEFVPIDSNNYFDLEDPLVAELMDNPMTALKGLKGLVVIDEAQRQPGIFPVLRVLADRVEQPEQFLIPGSASPERSRQAAESLAGRVERPSDFSGEITAGMRSTSSLMNGTELRAVEVKSGTTLHPSFFEGLSWFARQTDLSASRCVLVYGGESRQNRTVAEVHPWNDPVI